MPLYQHDDENMAKKYESTSSPIDRCVTRPGLGVQLVLGLSLGFMVIVKRLLSEETVLSLIQRDCWMSEIMASSESPPSPGSPECPDTFLGPGVNTSQ